MYRCFSQTCSSFSKLFAYSRSTSHQKWRNCVGIGREPVHPPFLAVFCTNLRICPWQGTQNPVYYIPANVFPSQFATALNKSSRCQIPNLLAPELPPCGPAEIPSLRPLLFFWGLFLIEHRGTRFTASDTYPHDAEAVETSSDRGRHAPPRRFRPQRGRPLIGPSKPRHPSQCGSSRPRCRIRSIRNDSAPPQGQNRASRGPIRHRCAPHGAFRSHQSLRIDSILHSNLKKLH